MRYDLAQLVRQQRKTRRREIAFRPIIPPATLAGDLYAAAYRPALTAWAGALPGILAAYEQALGELTTDSPSNIGVQLSQAESDVSRVMLTLRIALERWVARLERWQAAKWRATVLASSGVDVGMMLGPADMAVPVETVIERNVALVRSVSDQVRDRISGEVFDGLRNRRPVREVGRAIEEKVGLGRRRALNIAADQNVKLAETLNEERRREAGVETWAWVSSHKAHARPEHAKRDGKRYDDGAKSGEHKPPEDRPGQLPWCGCSSRAVLSLDGEF